MSTDRPPLRLLFVHAHPDDETLATGIAMAAHARAGDDVRLLTATLGEEGEVIPPELRHLAADATDALGPYRRGELRLAMSRLGVREQVLGEDVDRQEGSAFRDSGMAGSDAAGHPRAFCRADVTAAADLVRAQLESWRPDIVVTYDATGGYGHPDHIRTHEVVCAAVHALVPGERPTLYGRFTPRTDAEADQAWLVDHVGPDATAHVPGVGEAYPPSVVRDAVVTHEVVGDAAVLAARDRALAEHRTQVVVHDGWYTLSNDVAARLVDREGYALLDPRTGEPVPAVDGRARRRGLLTIAARR